MAESGRSAESQAGQQLYLPSRSTPADIHSEEKDGDENGSGARVLVVDDERGIRRFLHASLINHGYDVHEAENGQQALQAVPTLRPDVIILDLGLPDIDGLHVTRLLREWVQTPIIVLSVRNQESDKISALDAGADDYLTKPFGSGELSARIRAALRRSSQSGACAVFTAGGLEMDLARRTVKMTGRKVQLTPTEYDLLKVLVRYSGKVITHRQLIREVWGGTCYEDDIHLLRVNVSNLRRKLESNPTQPRYVVTEPGVGYRFRTE